MQITRITKTGAIEADVPKPTNFDLQNEYYYILACQLTQKLLDGGLITEEEYGRIMAKNTESFAPLISKIMQK